MIVTKQQLQQLIDEEFSRALEKRKQRLNEERVHPAYRQELNECSAEALLEFAKAYRSMGDAVAEQLINLMGDPRAECNSNAVEMIKRNLGGCNQEIDDAIAAWEDYHSGEFDEDDGPAALDRVR